MILRGTTRLLGILGNPLSHSYSPAMHNAAIEGLGLDLVYLPLKVEPSGLEACLRSLRELDFLGVNVTLPYKEAVIPYLDEVSDLSRIMGAVNTIVQGQDGKLSGTTTDPEGFLAGFHEAGHTFDGKSIVILGNGGSARTLAFALFLMATPRRVTLAARNTARSSELVQEIHSRLNHKLEMIDLQDYPKHQAEFEIVVHTTPVGMHPKTEESLLPLEMLEPTQIVYDLTYNPEETLLLRRARQRGCRTVGGLGMLVHQGIASFKLWTGIDADPAYYYAGIRRQREAQALPKTQHEGGTE
jgi:shikimate dehydrogenase